MAIITINVGDDWQTAVTASTAGDVFKIASGTHRLQSVSPKANQTFTALDPTNPPVMSGAKLLASASFTASGGLWFITGQTQTIAARHGECQLTLADGYTGTIVWPVSYPTCDYEEELFFDSPVSVSASGRKVRVESTGACGPGKWFFDDAANRIYVGDDPTGHVVEVSVNTHAFEKTADGVTISYLTIEKYACEAQDGAVDAEDTTGWRILNCTLRLNHGGGIRLGNSTYLYNTLITLNGQIGPNGIGDHVVVANCEISYNNDAHFDAGWEAGGTKFVLCNNLTVCRNYVHHNGGPGIWADIDNDDCVYEFNESVDNEQMGMFHEISWKAHIRYNTVRRNGLAGWVQGYTFGAGILNAASSNVQAFRNEVSDNRGGIVGLQQSRGSGTQGPHVIVNFDVHDNVTAINSSTATPTWSGLKDDTASATIHVSDGNSFNRNRYYATAAEQHWTWTGDFTYAQWVSAGLDAAGSIATYATFVQSTLAFIAQSTFSGTAGANLTDYVGELGGLWTKADVGEGSGNLVLTPAGRFRPSTGEFTGGPTARYYCSGIPATPDYKVMADFLLLSTLPTDAYPSLVGRMDYQTGQKTQYGVTYVPDITAFVLEKVIDNVATTLATYTFTPVVGQRYHVELWLTDALKSMVINGTVQGTSADNAITARGRAGVSGYFGTAGTDSTGWQFDNFYMVGTAGSDGTGDIRWAPITVMLAGRRRLAVPSGFTP